MATNNPNVPIEDLLNLNIDSLSQTNEPENLNIDTPSQTNEPENLNIEPENLNIEPENLNIETPSQTNEPENLNIEPESQVNVPQPPEIIPADPVFDPIAHFDSIAVRIEQTFRDLINQLIARKNELLSQLDRLLEEYTNAEATRIEALQEIEKAQLQFHQMNIKVNINLQLYEQTKVMYQQQKRDLEFPSKLTHFICPTITLLQSQIQQFGELFQQQPFNYSQKQQPILTAGKRGNRENELDGCGLALDEPNQKVYIADCNNSHIQLISFQGEFLSRFGMQVLKEPTGITVTEDHVFVTDWYLDKLFQFCKHTHQLLNTAGGKGKNEGRLKSPYGLSIDRNGDVFIAEVNNNRVSVFSKQLKYKSYLGEIVLSYPRDVKLTPDKVVVLDCSPKCIHFFNRRGHFLTSCVSQGEGQECFVYSPRFFCLDNEQNILISDTDHHTVKIVSNSGELLHIIGREGQEKGEFYYPFGIAISNSGILFVLSDNTNYSLQCF